MLNRLNTLLKVSLKTQDLPLSRKIKNLSATLNVFIINDKIIRL